ncbi:MAG: aspartate aminotransferase family protein [Verrucomicrobiae bacterium]|nr:aspartate aminotransferase family protein [Verrucomicrobiae bacterium]
MKSAEIVDLFTKQVVPSYGRYPMAFVRGKGTRIWDAEGREYLDFCTGIAVNALGHAHPAIAETLYRQAQTLIHTSNLYHTEPQGRLAGRLVALMGDGKCFFCNSGGEANEALFKLARKFGHDEGRYEIITTLNSFHGRTLAGIAATGQDKVKKGFEPPVDGFKHVPYNDLAAMEQAIGPKTIAILIEGIQGEGGIHPATPAYLRGLRELCNRKKLLLLMDSVQCGMFRSGRFQSFQRILEACPGDDFLPDAVSMAKGLGGGVPIGCIWARQPYANLLSAGSHGTTFGGTPLICAVALTVLDIVEKENLGENARRMGEHLKKRLASLNSPHIKEIRGLGLIMGIELKAGIPSLKAEGKLPSALFINRLHDQGLLTVPAGAQTIRFLPPLNLSLAEADEGIDRFRKALAGLQ